MVALKVSVRVGEGDGEPAQLLSADVVSYKGSNWFVPKWRERPNEGWRTPERIVCLDTIHHRKVDFGATQYVIDDPIPRAVLFGDAPPAQESEFLVEYQPDIQVPIPRGSH